jgi:putative transposase
MSRYNPQIHDRNSFRLSGYDYSKPGFYFVTICCQDRLHFWGEVKEEEMQLNEAGKMVEKWYFKLEEKFPEIKCHEMIVMPNHFHCIIEIYPTKNNIEKNGRGDPTWSPKITGSPKINGSPKITGSPHSIGLATVIGWFKTMTTNEYIRGVKQLGWRKFNKRLWQRNYFEIIIRGEKSYQHIT